MSIEIGADDVVFIVVSRKKSEMLRSEMDYFPG